MLTGLKNDELSFIITHRLFVFRDNCGWHDETVGILTNCLPPKRKEISLIFINQYLNQPYRWSGHLMHDLVGGISVPTIRRVPQEFYG